MSATASRIGVGDELPADIALPNQHGDVVRLADFRHGTLVLFFFVRSYTPDCVTQACAMRDNYPLLRERGVNVFGVGPQSPGANGKFTEKLDLPFDVLADDNRDLARRFGFADDTLLGKLKGGIVRSTVIVDPGGTVRAMMRDVKADAHFDLLKVQIGA